MSIFFCPNAQRSLARAALRGVASKTQQPFASPRWISSCVSRGRQTVCAGQRVHAQARCRVTSVVLGYPNGSRRTFFTDKTIKKYEDLPRDYRDQTGLSFGAADLTEEEVLRLFGPDLNVKAANHLMRILHGRRVAGTLEDPSFKIHTAQFTEEQINKALEYLRKRVPVDEIMNAGLRAEDELAQIELDMEAKNKPATPAKEKDQAVVENDYKPDSVYGHSKFDEIRSRNIAKRKAQEAALEEERRAAEARGEQNSGTLANVKTETREITNPKIAEYYKKAQSDLEAPPEMKSWERILPSATVVALVLGFFAAVAMVYEEPAPRFRLFREISTAHATVGTLLALNVLVFMAWRIAPLWSLFNRYMIMVVATVKPVTLFTSTISHQKITHLVTNMAILWMIGNAVHEEVGRAHFLALYFGCGALGFLGSLITYTLRGMLHVTTLGASGATLGLLSAYFWEHRDDGFRFAGLPQEGVHGIIFLALLFVPQLLGFGKTAKNKVDVASHVAGMLAGALGIEIINRESVAKKKEVIEVFPREGRMKPIATLEPTAQEALSEGVKK